MKRRLLSIEERQNKTCYFCGNKYAKYVLMSDEIMRWPYDRIPIPCELYACNVCALKVTALREVKTN